TLWSIAALLAAIANWFATLILGRSPEALDRFLSAYVRYAVHMNAFLLLGANPFPGFTGAAGSYPVDVEIAPRERQHRLKTLFRVVLVIPATFVGGVAGGGGGGGEFGVGGGQSARGAWVSLLGYGVWVGFLTF